MAAHWVGTLVLLLLRPATYTGCCVLHSWRDGAESLSVSGSVGVAAELVCSGSVPWLNSVARVGLMGEDRWRGLGRWVEERMQRSSAWPGGTWLWLCFQLPGLGAKGCFGDAGLEEQGLDMRKPTTPRTGEVRAGLSR